MGISIKKFCRAGIGGIFCPCCFPRRDTKQGRKQRTVEFRAARKRADRDALKIEIAELIAELEEAEREEK